MNYVRSIPLLLLAVQCGYFIKKTDDWSTTGGLLMHHALCLALCAAVVVGLRTALWPIPGPYGAVAYLFGALVLATLAGRFGLSNTDRAKYKAFIFAIANGVLAVAASRGIL